MNITTGSLEKTDNYRIENMLKKTQDLSRMAKNKNKLKDVCSEFEAIFINQMFKGLRKSMKTSKPLLHGGMAEDIFKDMLFSEYSKISAKTSSIGLAKLVYDFVMENRGL